MILSGTLLLMLPISNKNFQFLNWLDALFTATSATCVTGLSVFTVADQLNWFWSADSASADSGRRSWTDDIYGGLYSDCEKPSLYE